MLPSAPKPLAARPATALKGEVRPPGDKSISHRALILGSQGLGVTAISGLLESEDVLNTATALAACGVRIEEKAGTWLVEGVGLGGLAEPAQVLDCGNSGTGARLLMGLLAGHDFPAFFSGDASLCKRPMARVMEPLEKMGAEFFARRGGRLPLGLRGPERLIPIDYALPVPSAQVKSAILLAGLNAPGATSVFEAEPTRDHTERMLRFLGVEVESHPEAGGVRHILHAPEQYRGQLLDVPADPSSAAFPLVAALLIEGSDILIRDVCLNPLRTGLFTTLREMGAELNFQHMRVQGGEEVADIRVRASALSGVEVPAARAPSMIDEYPVLAVAAAFATGETVMRGLAELRVKESDRLAMIAAGLAANGVMARIEGDDLMVTGSGGKPPGGGTVATAFDHRIAMSFLVMGLAARAAVTVDDTRAIATSFPDFLPLMNKLGAGMG